MRRAAAPGITEPVRFPDTGSTGPGCRRSDRCQPALTRAEQRCHQQAEPAAMVEQLTTMSQQRQKIIARNFANHFVKPLFEVYRLVVENEQQEKIIDISGMFVPINPGSGRRRGRDGRAKTRIWRTGPRSARCWQFTSYSAKTRPCADVLAAQRHAMLKKILEQQGILNVMNTDTARSDPAGTARSCTADASTDGSQAARAARTPDRRCRNAGTN